MANKFPKVRESFTTPVGELTYPWLNAPKTVGEYADGKFHCDLVLEGEALEFVRAKVMAFGVKCYDKKWEVMSDMKDLTPLKQNKEGAWVLVSKSKDRPKIADASGNLIPAKALPKIGSGTRARLNVTLNRWEKGVNCYINGVQIIQLEEYNGGNAKFTDMSGEAGSEGYKYDSTSESGFDEVEDTSEKPASTKASAF